MGTGPHKSLATPSGTCHCPFPLPPALCRHEETVSLHQPSLLSKRPALQGERAVSGPHQMGTGAQPGGNRAQQALGGARARKGWDFWGKGFAMGHRAAPQWETDQDPLWPKAWLGSGLQETAAFGGSGQDAEEMNDMGSDPGPALTVCDLESLLAVPQPQASVSLSVKAES